jgi:hypothetical protein
MSKTPLTQDCDLRKNGKQGVYIPGAPNLRRRENVATRSPAGAGTATGSSTNMPSR